MFSGYFWKVLYLSLSDSLLLQHICTCSIKMPEGPELHLASLYVNKMCDGMVFGGTVIKSEVSKCPEVAFTCDSYRITATSRGKEVKLTLTPMKSDDDGNRRSKGGQADQHMDIVFRFGMSGYFRFTSEEEVPKHAHLRFYTKEKPRRVLSFVDTRRFGSWQPNGTWQPDRGPCIMFEYKSFRFVMLRMSLVTNLSQILLSDWSLQSSLQGECLVSSERSGFWSPDLWGPAEPKVLQWYWELFKSWNPVQVMNMHENNMIYSTHLSSERF